MATVFGYYLQRVSRWILPIVGVSSLPAMWTSSLWRVATLQLLLGVDTPLLAAGLFILRVLSAYCLLNSQATLR